MNLRTKYKRYFRAACTTLLLLAFVGCAKDKLVEYGLICEAGRLDAPGRPITFATTEEFLRYFGIESLDDLPILNQETIEDFKEEAEREVMEELEAEGENEE